jgi:hypothetical protein
LALPLTIARYADLQTTYFSTPDLKTEANPLVSKLGFDWTELIISQVIFVGLLIYFLWIYSFRTVRTPIFDSKLPLNKFVSLFYFNDIKGFYRILYKLPTNRNSLLYSFGFILTYTFIIWSFVVSVSTILLLINKSYRSFYISNSQNEYYRDKLSANIRLAPSLQRDAPKPRGRRLIKMNLE